MTLVEAIAEWQQEALSMGCGLRIESIQAVLKR
jgi:hypothetical protein